MKKLDEKDATVRLHVPLTQTMRDQFEKTSGGKRNMAKRARELIAADIAANTKPKRARKAATEEGITA